MRLQYLALCLVVCLCGCKKKSAESSSANSPSTPGADASKPEAAITTAAAPGPQRPATAPYNPKLTVPPPGPPVTVNGVTINVQNAEKALVTASWDANVALGNLRTDLRYEDYRAALGHLQTVAADPSLNESQKAAVSQVMQEVNQAAAKAPR